MARPKGNPKKRKAASQPPGGPAVRPSKRHLNKKAPQDVYEAEDSDPDEVKHSRRYDSVENYEYEMPSDFEDEEIDEEMAFTAEDKKKYAGWFDDMQAGGDYSDEGAEAPDWEEEEEEDDMQAGREEESDEEGDEGDEGDDGEGLAGGEGEEEDGLLAQLGGSDEDEDEDEEEAEAADGNEDDERYRGMLASVLGDGGAKQQRGRVKQAVIDEAYPEAEFALHPGAASAGTGGELTLADLMQGLNGEGRQKLPAALRKELERMSKGTKSQLVAAPAPRVIRERAERQAGYQVTSHEVSKWQPIVKANREAPTLQFTAARDEVPRINTTAAMVAQHTPETEMESEVAALLQAAGAASATAVAAAEEALAVKELSVEEARERRNRLAKLRSLLFYHEQKAKRLKAIKSKEFRKKTAKADKRKSERALLAGADADDQGADAEAHQELETAEFERAKERLTLKHRNTSRWARRALKRGATLLDDGTRQAIGEQLRLGEALKRRIEGQQDSSDEEGSEDGGSASEGEAGAADVGRGMTTKAKALALDLLSGGGPLAEGEEAPKKGLFALPFMARALERKRIAAMQEATATLAELQGEGEQGQGQGVGRRKFGAGGQARGEEATLDMDEGVLDSDQEEDAEAKAERIQKRLQGVEVPAPQQTLQQRRRAAPTAADQADLDQALASTGSTSAASLKPNGTQAARSQKQPQQSQSASQSYIPAKSYQGTKPGYVFKKGKQGVGYYLDNPPVPQPQPVAIQQALHASKGAKASGNKAAIAAKIAGGETQPAQQQALSNGRQQQQQQPQKGAQQHQQQQQTVSGGDEGSDGEAPHEGMQPAPTSKAAMQKALVSMAFAGDDVEADFAAEKAAEVAAELPHIEEPSTLPGWGAWSEQQRDPKWMRDAKAKAQRERDKAAANRTDAKLQFVVLSEKWDRKAMSKYTVQQLPFPYDSQDTYERSIRQPLGRQYNPDTAFRDLTRPAVLKSTGVMINPIKYSKPLAKQAAEVTGKPSKANVLTVAGGVLKKPKKVK